MFFVQLHILKNAIKPKFTGYSLDWAQFAKDWERYSRKIACGEELTDGDKLALLEGCLDTGSQLWLQTLKDSETGTSFQEFYAQMEDRYGRHRDQGLEKMARSITPKFGISTLTVWCSWFIYVLLAMFSLQLNNFCSLVYLMEGYSTGRKRSMEQKYLVDKGKDPELVELDAPAS
jgi:predicted  nucleic acid-binding Zn-ribbon protein